MRYYYQARDIEWLVSIPSLEYSITWWGVGSPDGWYQQDYIWKRDRPYQFSMFRNRNAPWRPTTIRHRFITLSGEARVGDRLQRGYGGPLHKIRNPERQKLGAFKVSHFRGTHSQPYKKKTRWVGLKVPSNRLTIKDRK